MRGISTIRKFRCPLGLCVIIAFTFAYSCNILCNLGVMSLYRHVAKVSTIKSHDATHHDHSAKHNHGPHDHSDGKHDHSKNKDGGCCDDITKRLYSSLVNNASEYAGLIKAEVHKLLTTFYISDFATIGTCKLGIVVVKFDYKPKGPPGHVGQYLHILFSSFLI